MYNILIILTDQQRKDSLGCYGHPVCRTPNLDALAQRGRRFERHYVANPICMPSRRSIFTGQYPSTHGMWTNGLLVDERPTLATCLAAQGYRTASVGKLHFTPYGGDAGNVESQQRWQGQTASEPLRDYWGFQRVELSLGHTTDLAHYGQWFYDHGGTAAMREPDSRGNRPMPESLHDSAWVAERAAAYLADHDGDQPFFLVASFPDPHHPFDPPQSAFDRYDPAAVPMPVGGPEDMESRPPHYAQQFRGQWHRRGLIDAAHPQGVDESTTRRQIAQTCAMVDMIDQGVGRILDQLETSGLTENTLVVFLSDHGELLGDHGLWLKGPFFYEGLINTPLLVAGPGVASGVSASLFSDVDLAATLCDLAGAEPPPFHDGINQAAHLGDAATPGLRQQCFVEYRNGFGSADVAARAVVTSRWKYVRYEDGQEELTDLHTDPQELHNCVADAACEDALTQLRDALLTACLSIKPRGPRQIAHA